MPFQSETALKKILTGLQPQPERIFLLTDSHVAPLLGGYRAVLRAFAAAQSLPSPAEIVIRAGESSKTLLTVESVASALSSGGATRRSLLVAAGGGVVTDLGGFAAAIFKRGIRHINIATTILGAVDAAIGGKTAVDFALSGTEVLKNELGAFHMPAGVVAASELFGSLSSAQALDGYVEMVKTAMLDSPAFYSQLLEAEDVLSDSDALDRAVRRCARFKSEVVANDPEEKGLRRILNLGHTFGHAFEARLASTGRRRGHGECVAHGLLCTLIMSHLKLGLPSPEVSRYTTFLRTYYPELPLTCEDAAAVAGLIRHDKKSEGDAWPPMVLLSAIGKPESAEISDSLVATTWETYRSLV